MHFRIAQVLMKHYTDVKSKENIASHICESVDIIRARVTVRQPYRELLLACARTSTERGAWSTAAKLYTNAVALLQSDPWNDEAEDTSYDETNQLYLRAAETALYMGNHGAANALLGTILQFGKLRIRTTGPNPQPKVDRPKTTTQKPLPKASVSRRRVSQDECLKAITRYRHPKAMPTSRYATARAD